MKKCVKFKYRKSLTFFQNLNSICTSFRMLKTEHQHSTMSVIEAEMAEKCVNQLQSIGTSGNPMDRLRLLCLSRGATGILGLGRMFRRIDHDGRRRLNQEKFLLGLRESGMEITKDEGKRIFQEFDVHNSGAIDIDEFLKAIHPPMSESRKQIIEKAFQKMDKTGSGQLSLDELKRVYNVQYHPLYRSGEKSQEDILKRFLSHFEEGAARDGHVTREEFGNFYAAISASIDEDTYFDLMMRQCYNL